MKNEKQYEPYSYFFTAGIVSAAFGVALWILFSMKLLTFYPRQAHADFMFFGFLWSFIAGFLMTAVPKMTGAKAAQKSELYFGLLLVFLQWAANFQNAIGAAAWIYILQNLFLLFFVVRRFAERRQLPFEGFIFMPFAFAMSFAGIIIYMFDSGKIGVMYTLSGQAFVLNLICGIGSRLIPVLSRLPSAVSPDIPSDKNNRSRTLVYFSILAVVLNGSFIIEVLGWHKAGYLIRTIVFGWMAVNLFRVFQRPLARTFVGWGLKAGIAGIFLSYLALATGTVSDQLGRLHVMFIAGLSIITLMVATRVTVAHGGGFLDLELKSKAIPAVVILFWLSAIFRTLVGGSLNTMFILIAALFFLLALLFWFGRLIKILWKV